MQFIITNPEREQESQNDSCKNKKKLDFPIPVALPVNMGN